MPGTCQCGCGTPVAPGKSWVRGHNMRVLSAAPAPPRNQGGDQDVSHDRDQEPPAGAGEAPEWWEPGGQDDLAPPLTYEAAAGSVPDDPDPARMPSGPAPVTSEIRVTPRLVKDMEGKLAFWASVGIDLWNMVDPYCAGVAADNVDTMARKAVPLMVQSPDVVRFFMRASGFMMWTELMMACKPVFAAMIAHHVTKSVQVKNKAGALLAEQADWSAYTAA